MLNIIKCVDTVYPLLRTQGKIVGLSAHGEFKISSRMFTRLQHPLTFAPVILNVRNSYSTLSFDNFMPKAHTLEPERLNY